MKRLLKQLIITALVMILMLTALTSCGRVEFNVDFMVDGEVYSTLSTNGQEVIKLPDNPTKEGYEFKGWYWDENAWQKPFTANSLLDAPLTGDMRVYAKFDEIGTSMLETAPVPGTAYKLFLDQENIGERCYLNGLLNGYHFATSTEIEKSVNVYVEETSVPGQLHMFCVKDGVRLYLNIGKADNGQYAVSFNNSAFTSYEFDLNKCTMVASVDGNKFLLGEGRNNNYKRMGARTTTEASFVSHLVISMNPDETIPEPTVEESTIEGIIAGSLGKYKTSGTVVALNTQSFMISDGTGVILVFCEVDWTKDVNIGDTVDITGEIVMYGSSKQFASSSEYTVSGTSEVTYPTPTEPTSAELDAYATKELITPEYAKVSGVLSKSGSYYNVIFNGTTIVGSIVSPLEDLSALNGKNIEIVGYLSSVTGGNRYLNIIATSVTELDGELPGDPTSQKKTVAEVIGGELGASYTVDGVVIGVNAQSFLVGDNTGMMLVYRGRNWESDVEIGSLVTVSGITSSYGGAVQFDVSATYTVNGSKTVVQPIPAEPSAQELDAYATKTPIIPEYIKVKGVLTISGSYHNVAFDGAAIIGSITYPATDLSGLNGKTVELVGYVTGVTGGGSYLSILVISVEEVESQQPEIPDQPEEPEQPEAPEITKATVAEVFAGEIGTNYTVDGVVVGVNAQSFLFGDDTGLILVYFGKSWTPDVTLGSKVTVTGTSSAYAGAVQFGIGTTYTVNGKSDMTLLDAPEFTAAQLDAYSSMTLITPEYVKIKATVTISGTFCNLSFAGATITGSISYPAEDYSALHGKTVEIVGFITGVTGGGKYLNVMAISVKEIVETEPEEPELTKPTVADVLAGEIGTMHTVDGTVLCVNARSFLLGDETGSILVYLGGSWTPDVTVGTEVTVSGITSSYGGAVQFGSGTTYTVNGTKTVTPPAPKELTAQELDAYSEVTAVTPEYIKVKGVLTISGNYYNVAFDGASITGSLTYPAIDLSSFNGKTVEIVGYVTGVTGGGKYLSIMFASLTEA